VIIVGEYVCVIYGNDWSRQTSNRNQGKPSPGAMSSQGVGGVSIAPPHGREGSLSLEQNRDGPIRMVLQRLATQVCMSVLQQIRSIACKIE
jgi:hypothetical protein